MAQPDLFPPDAAWTPPDSLPDITGGVIGLDTETRDKGLANDVGPGWAHGMGHIAGISVAWGRSEQIYVNMKHPDSKVWDKRIVTNWLDHILSQNRVVFHNAGYDMGWLNHDFGVGWPTKYDDTMAMCVLLDENRYSYDLDTMCKEYGVTGKDEGLLAEAAASYGVGVKDGLWAMPARYVAPYAEQDARATLDLFQRLVPIMDTEKVGEAYRLEADIMPLCMQMRKNGIRIDASQLNTRKNDMFRLRDEQLARVKDKLTWPLDITIEHMNSPKWLEQMFAAESLEFPRTAKTKQASFKKDWLENHIHWLPQAVARSRQLHNMGEKFIGNYIQSNMHRGRVHPEINQLRDGKKGTRSYRFSYSNPPLQQIPGRDPEFTALVRGLFLPEEGELWHAPDYSQQEPFLTVHYASLLGLTGSDEAVKYLKNSNNPDYHQMIADMAMISRKEAKPINLGLAYGMGVPKLAVSLGVSVEEAQRMVNEYHERVPFISEFTGKAGKIASTKGEVKLLDGRKCRFPLWEPAWRKKGEEFEALPYQAARARWGNSRKLKRAFTHKSMNRIIQGSAAIQTKLAMREAWRAGFVPLIQMHDELGQSVSNERDAMLLRDIMRDTVKLRVPVKVDSEFGTNWGNATKTYDEARKELSNV